MRPKSIVFLILVLLIVFTVPLLALATSDSHSEASHETGHEGGHDSVPWYRSMNLWKTINLGVLLFVVYKLMAVPLSRFFSERTDAVDQSLKDAEQEKEQSREEFNTMQDRFAAAKDEIESIISRGEDNAKKAINEIKEHTAAEIETLKVRATESLAQEVSKARQELITFIASKAIAQAQEKIEKLDSDKLQADYLKKFHETLKPEGGNGERP